MSLETTLKNLLKKERELFANGGHKSALPENCYFLNRDTILCYPRTTGDSRYPYSTDGFTLWAYSSGYMSLNESTFYYVLPADEGKEPYLNFFGGLKNGNGYTPVSLTGVSRQPNETCRRFTVYSPTAVYYVTVTKDIAFCVRAFVSPEKKACFTVGALNLSDKKQEIYLSAYFNCLLMHQAGESVETKWFKQCTALDTGFLFESVEDLDRTTHLENFGVIKRDVSANVIYAEHTTSRSDYVGGKNNCQICATPLFCGHFEKQKPVCKFTDTAVAGDIYSITLDKNAFSYLDYVLEAVFDKKEVDLTTGISGYAENCLQNAIKADEVKQNSDKMLKMEFGTFKDNAMNGEVFTKFISNVMRQVEFAALAKNSGVSLLGVRDVAQQLEAALMWNPSACRAKILELLNFLDPSGRAPRQYSLPAKGALPQMDTREFVDQGVWIIDLIYSYLSFTGDYSILDEVCGYYKIVARNRVEETSLKNSVFDHITAISDYLISNVDEATNCLRALYGDWNDALDGLGVSMDKSKEYGSGVSVMATLQLYKNLCNLIEIIDTVGDRNNRKAIYTDTLARLKKGLSEFAIEKDGLGNRKILHGWGDNRSYKVGSFNDVDNKSRDGLTANAFWVISGAYLWDTTIKKDILRSYKNLDSKYGLKTFEPYFEKGVKGVGRIVNLPKGTAENGATYVHATLFGVRSLFEMGEGKLAFEQLYKALPITHKLISTTPFIMSNSYSYNEELGMDGESMSDWFTGSANVLIKTLTRCVFGINPDLKGVTLSPSSYMPFDSAKISLYLKGTILKLNYRNEGIGTRSFSVNGNPVTANFNKAKNAYELYLDISSLPSTTEITIID